MKDNQATSSQRSYLFSLYSKGIGERRARWYMHQLRLKGITLSEASKEIKRLQRVRLICGPTAMKPENWEDIQPSMAELEQFWAEFTSRVKLVKERI